MSLAYVPQQTGLWPRSPKPASRAANPVEGELAAIDALAHELMVRVPRGQVRYLRGARVVEDGERPTVVAEFDGLDRAFHELTSYGPHAEVFAPPELRERIARAARETADLYAAARRKTSA